MDNYLIRIPHQIFNAFTYLISFGDEQNVLIRSPAGMFFHQDLQRGDHLPKVFVSMLAAHFIGHI